jgi:hypothetical protein
MLRSLRKFDPEAKIFVLALDLYTERLLLSFNIHNVRVFSLNEIEDHNVEVARSNRSVVEFYWTLSSVFTSYVYDYLSGNFASLTYLDSDIFFYASPQTIFSQLVDGSSCIITPHNFSKRLMDREVNGKFCVQWVTFVNNDVGRQILHDWRRDCLDWCYYRLEDGKMGDQKYLDYWPANYDGVVILKNIGVGVAPWNYEDLYFKKVDGSILVNGQTLIFYHFHQFTHIGLGRFDRISKFYSDYMRVPEEVYGLYEAEIDHNFVCIEKVMAEKPYALNLGGAIQVRMRRFAQNYLPGAFKDKIRRYFL